MDKDGLKKRSVQVLIKSLVGMTFISVKHKIIYYDRGNTIRQKHKILPHSLSLNFRIDLVLN